MEGRAHEFGRQRRRAALSSALGPIHSQTLPWTRRKSSSGANWHSAIRSEKIFDQFAVLTAIWFTQCPELA